MPRRRNGPGAFLAAVGLVVTLSGLLTFLAVPAARHLDEKQAAEEGGAAQDHRQRAVARAGAVVTFSGAVLATVGIALLRRTANAGRPDGVLK